jgi:CHAT domain-containing protein/lipopolysaccharide biosynthesis regulator YciM
LTNKSIANVLISGLDTMQRTQGCNAAPFNRGYAGRILLPGVAFALCLLANVKIAAQTASQRAELKQLKEQLDKALAEKRYKDVESLAERRFALTEKTWAGNADLRSKEHLVTAIRLHQAALKLQYPGTFADAERMLNRELSMTETAVGKGHLETAFIHEVLGLGYGFEQKFDQAIDSYIRALEVRTQHQGANHPEVAEIHVRLGEIERKRGHYDAAEQKFRHAITLLEASPHANQELLADANIEIARTREFLGHPDDALKAYDKAIRILESRTIGNAAKLYLALEGSATCLVSAGRFGDAEARYQKALELLSKSKDQNDQLLAGGLTYLAQLYVRQNRWPEADAVCRRAVELLDKETPHASYQLWHTLATWADVHESQNHLDEACRLLSRSLTEAERYWGANHTALVSILGSLARVETGLGQHPQARRHVDRAMAILHSQVGPDHPENILALGTLADLYKAEGRREDAEAVYRRALQMNEAAYGPDGLQVMWSLSYLASLLMESGRLEEAEALYQRRLAIAERVFGKDSVEVLVGLNGVAHCRSLAGDHAGALALVDRAVAFQNRPEVNLEELLRALSLRVRLCWELGRREEALAGLKPMVELAERVRVAGSGGSADRAAAFGKFAWAYEKMVGWNAVVGNSAAAFEGAERARARSLTDEMEIGSNGWLRDVAPAEANRLQSQLASARRRLAELQQQLQIAATEAERTPEQRPKKQEELLDQLTKAQDDVATAYREIQEASPAFRLIVNREFSPISLDALQSWLKERSGVCLHYLIGEQDSYLLAIAPEGEPLILNLALTPEQAADLGVEPGPLTRERLQQVMRVGKVDLPVLLSDPERAAEASKRLVVLWKILVPEPASTPLLDGSADLLVVIPDGGLNLLPFESLVVANEGSPRYLLDVGPPVVYAPSATVLLNLTARKQTPTFTDRKPVLTVGDPVYGSPSRAGPVTTLASLSARARYGELGGTLNAIPYSGMESRWVAEVFAKQGVTTGRIVQAAATEANVRYNVPGRRYVHFACHGLVDQRHGNLFGALALTPGKNPTDPSDDGFLTLGETYELDLAGCDLTILSACQTNFGPQQRGEGTWALSRGFLVAGSRRVVASNWLVDDEAAASLVSYFCAGVAADENAGKTPNLAARLQAAKRWVREQPKWQSPYHWGAFVLLGPN